MLLSRLEPDDVTDFEKKFPTPGTNMHIVADHLILSAPALCRCHLANVVRSYDFNSYVGASP
jgi:hypothetical protein